MITAAEIIIRLLNPEPLTDEEIEEHYEWGDEPDSNSFVNFHHPFYVGMNTPVPDDPRIDPVLRESLDIRLKMRKKHERIHDTTRGVGALEPSNIWFFERPYRPLTAYLMMRKGLYRDDPDSLAGFIISLWTDTESARMDVWKEILEGFPLTHHGLGCDDMLDPSGRTTVYRGIAIDEGMEIDDDNWSWTTDRARAEWFAYRFAGMEGREVPMVLEGEVDNGKVLFCTNDRGESEVVSQAVEITHYWDLTDDKAST